MRREINAVIQFHSTGQAVSCSIGVVDLVQSRPCLAGRMGDRPTGKLHERTRPQDNNLVFWSSSFVHLSLGVISHQADEEDSRLNKIDDPDTAGYSLPGAMKLDDRIDFPAQLDTTSDMWLFHRKLFGE